MELYGYPGAIELPEDVESDPTTGRVRIRRWRVPSDLRYQFINDLESNGNSVRSSADGDTGFHVIASRQAGAESQDDTVTEVWALAGNSLEKSIWNIPKVVQMFATMLDVDGIPKLEYFQRKRDIEGLVDGSTIVTGLSWWNNASADWKKLVRAVVRGEEAKTIPQFVVRRTRMYQRFDIIPAAIVENAGRVFSRDAFIAREGVPGAWVQILPQGVFAKMAPDVDQEKGTGKWIVINEWYHADSYDEFLWDPIITS